MQFKMCRIAYKTKIPLGNNWQEEENTYTEWQEGYNMGVVHSLSGTCCIDIDNLDYARTWFAERNVSIDMLLITGLQISSGVDNHGKLLYRLPFPMQSKKIKHDKKDCIDFRCMGMQDLLPPSIHPSGSTYQWVGDTSNIPIIPQELLDIWVNELTPAKPTLPSIPTTDPGAEEVAKLLNFCDPDTDRMTWINIGMAVHNLNPNYFELWFNWSSRATEQGKFQGQQDCLIQWNSFKNKENGVTGKSLYYYAVKGGYGPSLEQALAIFREIADDTEDESLIFEKRFIPNMPMEIIPPVLREYAEEIAHKIGANPIVPIAAGLTAICTAANSISRLELQPGYTVPPVAWNIVVAPPAAKKSPASKPLFTPFRTFEIEDRPRYKLEAKKFKSHLAAWASAEKNHLKAAESAEWLADGMREDQLPFVPDEPKPPVPLRFTFTDATSQKVVDLIESRPGGLSLVLDEGKTWFDKICNPMGSEDRSFWTQSYEADKYSFDRVSRGTIYIDNLAISTYVNIQPAVLSKNLKNLEEDGLFQRFTPFVVPTDKCTNTSNEFPDFMSKAPTWEHLLRRIKSTDLTYYSLSGEAIKEFRQFELWVNEKQQDHALLNSPYGFQSALGKMLGLCGRYAFIFHLAIDPEQKTVPIERVKDSILFMKEYVYYTLRDISLMSGSQPLDEWVFDWIITGEEESFTLSQVKKSARKQIDKYTVFEQQKRIEEALDFLAETGVIMKIERGLNRTDTYAVNPTIRERYHERRIKTVKAKYRDKKQREELVKRVGKTPRETPVRGQHLIENE